MPSTSSGWPHNPNNDGVIASNQKDNSSIRTSFDDNLEKERLERNFEQNHGFSVHNNPTLHSPSSSTATYKPTIAANSSRVVPSDLPLSQNLKKEDGEVHQQLVNMNMPPLISANESPVLNRRISQCSTASNGSGINSPMYESVQIRDMSEGNKPNISAIENRNDFKGMALSMHLESKADASDVAGEREKDGLYNSYGTKEPLADRSSSPPQNIDGKIAHQFHFKFIFDNLCIVFNNSCHKFS